MNFSHKEVGVTYSHIFPFWRASLNLFKKEEDYVYNEEDGWMEAKWDDSGTEFGNDYINEDKNQGIGLQNVFSFLQFPVN